MYQVITILKKTGEKSGYLGDFEAYEEAQTVAARYNRNSDRHPGIAKVVAKIGEPEPSPASTQGSGLRIRRNSSPLLAQRPARERANPIAISDPEEEDVASGILFDQQHDDEDEDFSDQHIKAMPVKENPRGESTFHHLPNIPRYQPQRTSQRSEGRHQLENDHPFMFAKEEPEQPNSYGGILIDEEGYVLLREPANHYRGMRWEFAGGQPNYGETPQQTALREVREETGYVSEIVQPLPTYSIGNQQQKFFLMSPTHESRWKGQNSWREETWETVWVSQDEAWDMLGKNPPPYRKVLRQVLDDAFTAWRQR
tara:strand:- start:289 stop:1224 length:936 start_codon:yes stop_codon:yes gene_type:complete